MDISKIRESKNPSIEMAYFTRKGRQPSPLAYLSPGTPENWVSSFPYNGFSVIGESGLNLAGAFQHHEVNKSTTNQQCPKSTCQNSNAHVKERWNLASVDKLHFASLYFKTVIKLREHHCIKKLGRTVLSCPHPKLSMRQITKGSYDANSGY